MNCLRRKCHGTLPVDRSARDRDALLCILSEDKNILLHPEYFLNDAISLPFTTSCFEFCLAKTGYDSSLSNDGFLKFQVKGKVTSRIDQDVLRSA